MTQTLAWAAEWVLASFTEIGAEKGRALRFLLHMWYAGSVLETPPQKRGPGAHEGERT